MKNPKNILLLAILLILTSGCDKLNAASSSVKAQNSVVPGKILYSWSGFPVKNNIKRGACIYSAGKIDKAFPEAITAIWVGDDEVALVPNNQNNASGGEEVELEIRELTSHQRKVFIIPEMAKFRFLPDGESLMLMVFMDDGVKNSSKRELQIFNTESKSLKTINFESKQMGWNLEGFDLSPNGQKIAAIFGNNRARESRLLITDLKGVILEEIPVSGASRPTWSPNSLQIAFSLVFQDDPKADIRNVEIAIYDLVTKEVKRLTHNQGISSEPVFSPDGTMIAYIKWIQGGRANNISIIDLEGNVIADSILPEDHVRQGQISNPDWGP